VTAPNDVLNDLHWAVLEALDRGEHPVIPPLMRKKLHRMGLINPAEPPHSPRARDGRVPAPRPRRSVLTAAGVQRAAERRVAEQTRHDVAASVARHAELDRHFDRMAPTIAAINAGMTKTGNSGGSP
jgi:hypothetical protein